jgi:hypothetical protein
MSMQAYQWRKALGRMHAFGSIYEPTLRWQSQTNLKWESDACTSAVKSTGQWAILRTMSHQPTQHLDVSMNDI